jgi:ABC-2 type transport system permease protein
VRYTALGAVRTWSLAPYPYLVQITGDGFLNADVTATLDTVGIYWGSPLAVDEEQAAGLDVLPILQSSELSWTSDDLTQVGYVDYTVPADGTRPRLLAVALGGRFKSYYVEHPVPGAGDESESAPPRGLDDGVEGSPAPPSPPPIPLEESPDTRLVVVGNSAFLSDLVARSLGQIDGGFFVENLRFVENLIDWVSLDSDMMEIRSRGLVSRRLNAVDKSTELTVEVVNYIVPLIALAALGLTLHYRRRRAAPLFETAPRKGG